MAGFTDRGTAVAAVEAVDSRRVAVVADEPVEVSPWAGTEEVTLITVPHPTDPQVLRITAGPTFGHGHHPTSALALELLAETVEAGDRVLDVGCGSGVLAIAAAKLGAEPVVAVDIDPRAVAVTAANAAANNVEIRATEGQRTGLGAIAGLAQSDHFDVVVANVLLPIHRDLASAVARVVAPTGTLITSGYLADQAEAVATVHRSAPTAGQFHTDQVREQDGWTAHRFRSIGGTAGS